MAVALCLLQGVAVIAGCGDECSSGQTRCANGDQIEHCASNGGDGVPGRLLWSVDTTCAGANPTGPMIVPRAAAW